MFVRRVNTKGHFTGGKPCVRGQLTDGHTVAQVGAVVQTATIFVKDDDTGKEYGLTINRTEHELLTRLFSGDF